ncbi:hypothetical protein [uncultured Shimia sp.]|uniref:hypothetical protein n=1 Tax=uncultured Shimia sp. TaxID=573152 RepID=UPI00260D3B14|nr:hypothetical protein [uncultured Shimia sp.]
MPLDDTNWEPRPEYDRDAVAASVQKELGRPLFWSEYVKIWNHLTAQMGKTDWCYDG